MIELRSAETDTDLEVWLSVRRAVLPNERTVTLEELRAAIKPGDLHLLAEIDGRVVGSGLANRSDTGNAHLAPRVLPGERGRGAGSALLRRLARHAVERGYRRAVSSVAGDDAASLRFASKFGFAETRRDIQQVLTLSRSAPTPREFDGVEFVAVADHPALLQEAFPLAQQGWADMPIEGLELHLEDWLRDEATLPAGSFVALADGDVVGYAGLMHWPGEPTKAEHGLTVVRRDWRRRGLATALKEHTIAWAVANGLRELVTYTQTGNESMQRVNQRLGYVTRSVTIACSRELPL